MAGRSFEEYVVDVLTQHLDPRESAEVYMSASRGLLEQAREELRRGNVRDAAEKV